MGVARRRVQEEGEVKGRGKGRRSRDRQMVARVLQGQAQLLQVA